MPERGGYKPDQSVPSRAIVWVGEKIAPRPDVPAHIQLLTSTATQMMGNTERIIIPEARIIELASTPAAKPALDRIADIVIDSLDLPPDILDNLLEMADVEPIVDMSLNHAYLAMQELGLVMEDVNNRQMPRINPARAQETRKRVLRDLIGSNPLRAGAANFSIQAMLEAVGQSNMSTDEVREFLYGVLNTITNLVIPPQQPRTGVLNRAYDATYYVMNRGKKEVSARALGEQHIFPPAVLEYARGNALYRAQVLEIIALLAAANHYKGGLEESGDVLMRVVNDAFTPYIKELANIERESRVDLLTRELTTEGKTKVRKAGKVDIQDAVAHHAGNVERITRAIQSQHSHSVQRNVPRAGIVRKDAESLAWERKELEPLRARLLALDSRILATQAAILAKNHNLDVLDSARLIAADTEGALRDEVYKTIVEVTGPAAGLGKAYRELVAAMHQQDAAQALLQITAALRKVSDYVDDALRDSKAAIDKMNSERDRIERGETEVLSGRREFLEQSIQNELGDNAIDEE